MQQNEPIFNIDIDDLLEPIGGIYRVKANHGEIVKQIYMTIPCHDMEQDIEQIKVLIGFYPKIYGHLQYLFARLLEYNKGRRITVDIDNLTKAIEVLAKTTKHQYDALSRKITIDHDSSMNRR